MTWKGWTVLGTWLGRCEFWAEEAVIRTVGFIVLGAEAVLAEIRRRR